ncbi:MAG: hypothetical protein WCO88_14625 [Actinomycetota bacterium]|jgi:single-stranded DNA-binding protein
MNIVVLRGRLSSAPVIRELASGSRLYSLEVTTVLPDGVSASLPVAWFDPPLTVRFEQGDEVVVGGSVRRRFFKGATGTQSRTEVVAESVVPATARRRVERLVATMAAQLGTPSAT